MANEAIIEAEYVEWRMVKTRSALQLVFEVPLEQQERVMRALGVPLPDKSNPVAICRLVEKAQRPAPQIEHANDEAPPPRPLSQISAMLCGKVTFRRFLTEMMEAGGGLTTEDAANWVRRYCHVASRREFDSDPNAAALFRDLRSSYDAWMRVPV